MPASATQFEPEDTWPRVKRLFDAALPLTADERADLLARSDASDAERREVLSLLAAHERARSFLATTAAGGGGGELRRGEQIGPYEVLDPVGAGGMGVVYRVRRADLERDAALKVMRRGLGSAQLEQRFRVEARVLARLEHPYIARLLDAGATAAGEPYVVMEFVEGALIDRHCSRARLGLRPRLELFHKVCQAVAYAHQRLVVHRDIKPGNILVTPGGEPKLLDFGLAKLLDAGDGEALTLAGLHAMTPEYASPEQVRGEAVTAATDVHALGLLLFALLTGQPALRLKGLTPAALFEAVCLETPRRPSQAVAELEAAATSELPEPRERLVRLLRGDLDTIVSKALRKEPERRYASVEQLADDVHRYLSGLPVLARPDTWRYRAGKFVGRHRLPVALAAACALALLGGLWATTWQARVARAERARAERRFAEVRRLATSLLFEFHDAIRELPGSTQAREMVVQQAVEHLGRLAAEAERDPTLQRELGLAYVQLGQVVGEIGGANLGDRRGALGHLERGVSLLESAHAARPEAALAGDLADAQRRLAHALTGQVRHADALRHLERARELAAVASRALGRVEDVLREVLIEEYTANLLADRSAWSEVAVRLARALERLQALPAEARARADVRRRRLTLGVRLGDALLQLSRPADTRRTLEPLVAEMLAAHAGAGNAERRLHGLAEAMLAQAAVGLEEPRPAQRHGAAACALFEEMQRADPANFQARVDRTVALSTVCDAHLLARQVPQARIACGAQLQLAQELADGHSQDAGLVWNLGFALDRQARLALAERRPAAALALYERLATLIGAPEDPLRRRAVASAHVGACKAARDLHRAPAAREHARRALALLEQARSETPDEPSVLLELAELQALLARLLDTGGAPDSAAAAEARGLREAARAHYRAVLRSGIHAPAPLRELRLVEQELAGRSAS